MSRSRSTDPASPSIAAVAFGIGLAVAAVLAASPAAASTTVPDSRTAHPTVLAGNATTDDTTNRSAEIVAIYPNPETDRDAGEFVVVRFGEQTNVSGWALADDETTVRLPNETVSGPVAVSPDPAVARNRTDHRVLAVDGHLSLANTGETVRLTADGAAVSTVTYGNAPEGERWHRPDDERSGRGATDGKVTGDDWRWTPLGATDFDVTRSGPAEARAFVLPDAPGVPVDTLETADRRLLLAGYTFTSARAADALAAAARRGVEVRVLVDAGPVGGLVRREAELLDSLVARGVEVRVLGDSLARYDFHHPKYAVVDERALVLTENWKPAGTGGRGSRGWGVAVRDEATADRLAEVYRADAGWRGATPWDEFRRGEDFQTANASEGSYPREIAPENVPVESTAVLVAPDNAEESLVGLLDSADESIRVQQASVGDRGFSLLRATLRAARRGVDVRVLLSSEWYVEENNRALVEWLNDRADREDLPLDARLANPRGRYEKIHAKGVVVDGDAAVVGSLNWNNNSARNNREVAVVLRGEEAGAYYTDAFDADWEASAGGPGGGGERLPVGLLAAVAIAAIAAIAYARREVTFEKG